VADHVSATGLLLLGGASARFGSPKALARFRGETLAERAHRVLREAFDEVLVVGKAGDALELPFDVLDDGVEDRAPLFGLLAGLRAATNDVCVALPVDCPLVTLEMLTRLASARGVPQTGPLPGAYARSDIPELERRAAAGELSLRGVNPSVVEVDESLLANVNTPTELVEAQVADWAREQPDVRAAVVVGSHARRDVPADRWSDLDVILVVDDPDAYATDATWADEFGEVVLTFLEPTAVADQRERRVLYANGEDVDFPLIPVTALDRLEASDNATDLIRRGYRVLHDKVALGERLAAIAATPMRSRAVGQREFTELASDFWYHALWAAKRLRRGEVFVAIECVDGYLKARVVELMAWHARAIDPSLDTWHAGRFVERWADPGALAALEDAYASYDLRDVARALWATVDLFHGLEEETARRLGLVLELDHVDLRRRLGEVVPAVRHGSTL
jgi:molybdopterin-guanine dinucleotide biosynthesis protein A